MLHKIMKKGQFSPIFTWIIVLVLAVSILFFGVKLFRETQDFTDEGFLVDFYNNLEKKINNYYYLDIESVGVEEFLLPSGVNKICFTNMTGSISSGEKASYLESLSSYSNVFVFPETEFKENRVNITKFVINENPLCVNVIGGRLKIKIKNIGKVVEIEDV